MTNRRTILRLLSLTTFLPFTAKAHLSPDAPTATEQQKSKRIQQWLSQERSPVTESTSPITNALILANTNKRPIAFYYYGGSSPRQLRLATIESVFRSPNSPHTYASAFCHLRRQHRIFRIDKISLA